MSMNNRAIACVVAGALALGVHVWRSDAIRAQTGTQVYELRTYTAAEGKLSMLSDRFRDRTMALFTKHGMQTVGAWIPTDAPRSENTLVFLMVWPSRAAADSTWKRFIDDPAWQALVADTEQDGRPWISLDRLWLRSTEYSPTK